MRYLFVAMLCLVLATPAAAMDWLGERAPAFVQSLQQMINADQREAIAQQVVYPLTVDGQASIADQAAFLQAYDAIFTKDVRQCVAGQDTSQNMQAIQSSYMIGWGCIWFDELLDGGGIGIWAVNTRAD